ncbi:MAG: DHA2 family efflux MFS transporter permease subunit [Novosphingobium sp.]|nr:DHA2 family efflux MFS transporter permease subunit [Novosphingobium sp.]
MQHDYPPRLQRNLITLFSLMGTFMVQLDTTIANVAMPQMQASTSASYEQITWVLTSYIIMAAIFMPLSGWLAGKIGRKRLVLISMTGFTIASVLCGMATTFEQLVAFRMLQGAFGAPLVPMSQAIVLDINPPENHGKAMGLWGVGVVFGPIIGPILGGLITDNLTWRWVFLINVPVGIIAVLGLALTMKETRDEDAPKFDLLGFGSLAVAIGCLQLMLDRGQTLDWFDSTEIWIEATLAITGFYIFIVHTLTAKRPFVSPALFRDVNFVTGLLFGVAVAGVLYGVMALQAPLLANLMGYPILTVGLVMAPRGIGTLIAMPIAGYLMDRFDARWLILTGMALCAWSLMMFAGSSLQMDPWLMIVAGTIQGIGIALLFVAITTAMFVTIEPRLRNEATAMNSLFRNLGGAMWIAILQATTIRGESTVRSRLAENVRPDNPMVSAGMPDFDFSLPEAIAGMDGEIARQALMVAYTNSFDLLFIMCILMIPLAFFFRTKRARS